MKEYEGEGGKTQLKGEREDPMRKEISVIAATVIVLTFGAAVQAAEFTVDSTADTHDATPGDGNCADSKGQCTLRAAVEESNALGGNDVHQISGAAAKYALGSTLNVSSFISLSGAGMGKKGTIILGSIGVTAVSVEAGAHLSLSDLTIGYSSHSDEIDGGCIFNGGDLTLERVQVKRCKALRGGGLYNQGTAHIVDSLFYGNHCDPAQGPVDAGGAAVYNAGSMVVQNTLLLYNRARSIARRNKSCPDGASGGGAFHNDGSLLLTNVTAWHNRSRRSCGGGLMNAMSGTATLINCTFSQNHGAFGSGGLVNRGVVSLVNSIINHSLTTQGTGEINCYGIPPISLGHNMEDGDTCQFTGPGDLPNTLADIGHPAAYGGPTLTMALSAGSPAIDAGDDVRCPPTDQRGYPRPAGEHCDIGAYEFGASPIATATPTSTAAPIDTPTPTEVPADTPTATAPGDTPTATTTETPTDTPSA